MADPSTAVTPHPSLAPRHGWRWRISFAVLALIVLGFLAGGGWWLTHPAFPTVGGANEGVVVAPGRSLWVAVTSPNVEVAPATVHLDSVTAHEVADTSAATVTPYVCTNQPGRSMLGAGGTAMMRHLCRRVVPANDADMTVGRGHPEYLMLKIVPAHAGRLRLDRVDVTYRRGLQRGTQEFDFQLTLTARPAA
jgi:hypothetical protein